MTSLAGGQSQAVLTPLGGVETISFMPIQVGYQLFCVVVFITACASTNAAGDLREASLRLSEAEVSGARDYAPYPFHKATLYLEQARKKNATADYGTSREYVKAVLENVKEALTITRQRKELERRRNERQDDKKRSLSPDLNAPDGSTP